MTVHLRAGRTEDADALASIHTRSRAAAMPWLPVLHDQAETRSWMRDVVLAEQRVVVAERNGRVVGFAAVHGDWLEQLYVAPEAIGSGVGRPLLDAAKAECPDGLSLYVFTRNVRARRFYEAAGSCSSLKGTAAPTRRTSPTASTAGSVLP